MFDMNLKEFTYNKNTKESHLAGVLLVILATVIWVGIIYYFFWV